MKNKNTKQMWIYAGVLLIVALALITITTLFQWKLIPENGNLQVLDNFTQTSNARIEQLTNENIELINQHHSDAAEIDSLTAEINALKDEKSFSDTFNDKLYHLLDAYFDENEDSVYTELKNFSEEELKKLQEVLPDFYEMINN